MLDLRSIPPAGEGHRVAIDLKEWSAGALAGEALPWAAEQLKVDAELHRVAAGREIVAHGRVRGALKTDCARCTGPATVKIDAPYDVTFVPPNSPALDEGDGESAGQSEAAVAAYHDEQIDLEPTLREQLILALPYAPHCQEDCKGLCSTCGADLNETTCGHAAGARPADAESDKPKNERWAAALRNVKL